MNNPKNLEENGQKLTGRPSKPEEPFESWYITAISQVNESISNMNREIGEMQAKIDQIPQMDKDLREVRDGMRDMIASKTAVNEYKDGVRSSREHFLKITRWIVGLILGLAGILGTIYTLLELYNN